MVPRIWVSGTVLLELWLNIEGFLSFSFFLLSGTPTLPLPCTPLVFGLQKSLVSASSFRVLHGLQLVISPLIIRPSPLPDPPGPSNISHNT